MFRLMQIFWKTIRLPFPVNDELVGYCINKLGISREQYNIYFNNENKNYQDYFTSEDILQYFKIPIKLLVKLKIITPVLYEKFFG